MTCGEWLDTTVEEHLTKAEMVCRRQVRALPYAELKAGMIERGLRFE